MSKRIHPDNLVLEFGCGYGRVLEKLKTEEVLFYGIDNSFDSIDYGKNSNSNSDEVFMFCSDVKNPSIKYNTFDLVFCIQNGISAMKINPVSLIRESIRITKPRGRILFSSYSDKIWQDRLEWFRIQANHGLIGEIDELKTGKGIIVCKDGFEATTFNAEQFNQLLSEFDKEYNIFEIDESSIFCEIIA